MTEKPRLNARERILETAGSLFYGRGINNVGVDEIVARSGVAKMSLYNHFGSKDGLVVEYLRREEERWQGWLKGVEEGRADAPSEQLLAVFDALEDWFQEPGFRGCAFINAAIEVADPDHPVHAACREHWRIFTAYACDLAERAGARDPEGLARQFVLLVQGAVVTALIEDSPASAPRARRMAKVLTGAE